MSERLTFRLWEPVQAHSLLTHHVWPRIKERLMAGQRLQLELRQETRSTEQNALLHALIGEIAGQAEWCGRKWDAEVWKRLLVAAWMRARGEQVMAVPALDGMGVDMVPVRTSRLTRSECAELIDYVQAWAAEHGIATGQHGVIEEAA